MYKLVNRNLKEFIIIYLVLLGKIENSHVSHKEGCSKFDPELNSIIEIRNFIKISKESSIKSISSIETNLHQNCAEQNQSFDVYTEFKKEQHAELQWIIQYHHEYSCIRIDLDLGNNLTHFKKVFDYDFYMFSYREFTKPNIHLMRHNISENVNTLVINHINHELNPYVVCVTFYKKNDIIIDSNDTNKSCDAYKEFIENDIRMQDIDLCVDININSKYLRMPVERKAALKSYQKYWVINPDVLTLLFKLFLLVIIMITITLAHHWIEKPKKKMMLTALRSYIQTKSSDTDDELSLTNSTDGPDIVVTDFSEKPYYNTSEDDCFLNKKPLRSSIRIEYSIDKGDEKKLESKQAHNLENTPAEKSILHLLDDKPWQISDKSLETSS